MKVLHLLGAREDSGGILTVLRNLQTAAPPDLEQAVWVHRQYAERRQPPLAYLSGRWLWQESPNHLGLLLRSLFGWREVRRAVDRGGFDLVHAHARGTLFVAAAIAGLGLRPALFTNHAFARRKGLYRWAARCRRLHTSVLTPNMARHYGLSTAPGGVAVISECCADRFFEVPAVGAVGGSIRDRPLRLVGLGNIVRWKNWHVLLEALRRLPAEDRVRVEFHHWGPVPIDAGCREYNEEIRAAAATLAPAICRFHGLSLDVEQPLRQADWFVLPSTNEPCSVALIEALALGLPALVSNSGGNVDIVDHDRTGVRFEPDNPADLARHLQRILHDEIHPVPPAQIRESVRHRSATAVAAQYTALYRQLLSA